MKKTKEKHTVRAMRAVVQRPKVPSMAEALFSWKPEWMKCKGTNTLRCVPMGVENFNLACRGSNVK